MVFTDFFNLVLVFKDVELRYGRTRARGFLSTVRVVFLLPCMLTIKLLKHLFIKFSE